jgi:superfamily I DNA/RNA helicase
MNEVLSSDTPPIHEFAYNRIIIDESQDMTSLYFQLVSRIVLHNRIKPQMEPRIVRYDGRESIVYVNVEPRMIVIGDKHQSIFTFNNADYRYITLAPEVFKFNGLLWKAAKLTTSYRITIPIATFLNKAVLHQDRLAAVKPSAIKPKYYICNPYSGAPVKIINEAIKKYGVQHIFILASSTRSTSSPVIKTANKISKKGHLIYVAGQEDIIDQNAAAGKLVVATFHQVKGLERKCVIVMGMDDSYFKFNDKNAPKNVCPNVFYVALTRASEELIMIHSDKSNFLPFINVEKLRETCDIQGEISKITEQPKLGGRGIDGSSG